MDAQAASRTLLALFVVSVPIGSLIIVHNVSEWRTNVAARKKLATLAVTTGLAVLTTLNALIALVAPKTTLGLDYPSIPPRSIYLDVPDVGVSVTLTLFAGVALAGDCLYTLHLYSLGYRMEVGRALERWKVALAHVYIWLLYMAPWLVYNVPSQFLMRDSQQYNQVRRNTTRGEFALIILVSLGSFVLQVLVSLAMIMTFIRSLNRLAEQGQLLAPDRIEALRILSTKSAIYVAVCLCLKLYLSWLYISWPQYLLAHVFTTPFLLGQLLTTHLCFNVKLSRPGRLHFGSVDIRSSLRQPSTEEEAGAAAPAVSAAALGARAAARGQRQWGPPSPQSSPQQADI